MALCRASSFDRTPRDVSVKAAPHTMHPFVLEVSSEAKYRSLWRPSQETTTFVSMKTTDLLRGGKEEHIKKKKYQALYVA